jgi:hypothetical protein
MLRVTSCSMQNFRPNLNLLFHFTLFFSISILVTQLWLLKIMCFASLALVCSGLDMCFSFDLCLYGCSLILLHQGRTIILVTFYGLFSFYASIFNLQRSRNNVQSLLKQCSLVLTFMNPLPLISKIHNRKCTAIFTLESRLTIMS